MSEPDSALCSGPDDVGRLLHDDDADIWYECVHDQRVGVFTWAIVPSVDGREPDADEPSA